MKHSTNITYRKLNVFLSPSTPNISWYNDNSSGYSTDSTQLADPLADNPVHLQQMIYFLIPVIPLHISHIVSILLKRSLRQNIYYILLRSSIGRNRSLHCLQHHIRCIHSVHFGNNYGQIYESTICTSVSRYLSTFPVARRSDHYMGFLVASGRWIPTSDRPEHTDNYSARVLNLKFFLGETGSEQTPEQHNIIEPLFRCSR